MTFVVKKLFELLIRRYCRSSKSACLGLGLIAATTTGRLVIASQILEFSHRNASMICKTSHLAGDADRASPSEMPLTYLLDKCQD